MLDKCHSLHYARVSSPHTLTPTHTRTHASAMLDESFPLFAPLPDVQWMSWRCHGNESRGLAAAAATAVFFVVHTARAASHFFGCESREDVAQRFTFYTRQQGALSQPLCPGKEKD